MRTQDKRHEAEQQKHKNALQPDVDLELIKIDYTQWQKKLWQDETVESLSEKAQRAWE